MEIANVVRAIAWDSEGRTIWIVDAHRDDGNRFVVRADEKLTAFLELESGKEGASGWPTAAWSDDTCPKSLFEEIMRLRDEP